MAGNLFEEFLNLIEDSFNINDSSIGSSMVDMGDWLDRYKKNLIPNNQLINAIKVNENKSENLKQQREEAVRLRHEQVQLRIQSEGDILDKVNDITDEIARQVNNFGHLNITKIISMSDSIVDDLEATRDWMNAYKSFIRKLGRTKFNNIEALVAVGKAILGRAIELCPYKTGLLRKSGILLVYKDYIEIVFTAPYATYAHENMENNHPYGRAKFLELALQEFFPNKSVWVEIHGESIVYARISINYDITYKHYD